MKSRAEPRIEANLALIRGLESRIEKFLKPIMSTQIKLLLKITYK